MNPGKRMLLLLAAVFLAPLAIAFYMYYGPAGFSPSKSVNHGELISPARTLAPMSLLLAGPPAEGRTAPDFLRHHWTLLYVGEGACDARCRAALYDTRQVRLALDRDMLRVQRVFVATGACCAFEYLEREHRDLRVVRADSAATPLLAQTTAAAGSVYLIDPLGNLIMSYAPGVAAKGMLEDMKRLLKLSQIG